MVKNEREKIEAWVEANPDGYFQKSLQQIVIETGTSMTSVDWHLPGIIANRDGILPSEVMAKRIKAGFRPRELSIETVTEMRRLYEEEGMSKLDIAYLLKINIITVRKYLK